jgi:hypothetical protein
MPYNAINNLTIGTDWSNSTSFESLEDVTKLDILVKPGGADVLIQWLEGDDRSFPTDEKLYVSLLQGFHSIPFETPIRRFRFKQDPKGEGFGSTKCTVSIREFS